MFRYFIFRYVLRNLKVWEGQDRGHGKDVLEYNFNKIGCSIIKHERYATYNLTIGDD